jgi:hypothetical protein
VSDGLRRRTSERASLSSGSPAALVAPSAATSVSCRASGDPACAAGDRYIEHDPRPLVVQAFLAVFLMSCSSFSSMRWRLGGKEASPAARLLDARTHRTVARPRRVAVFHPMAPRRVMQLRAVLALVPPSHRWAQWANPIAFAGVLLLVLDLRSALQPLPALDRATCSPDGHLRVGPLALAPR